MAQAKRHRRLGANTVRGLVEQPQQYGMLSLVGSANVESRMVQLEGIDLHVGVTGQGPTLSS